MAKWTHSTINYFIYITYGEITNYYELIGPDLSAHWLILLQRFSSPNESLTQKLEPRLLFSHPEFLCFSIVSLVSNLIYNFLLLFIGNLKIASTWIDWLTIKDYNNYLPNNLASKINSTSLHCWIMESSLLSDWPTRSWLIQTLTESTESQVRICEWLIFPTLPLNYEQKGIFKRKIYKMFQSLDMLCLWQSSLWRTCHSNITTQILESILC